MKRYLRLLLPILMIGIITISCSAQKTFGDLGDIKGVSSVYIGKTMLKMAGTLNLQDLMVEDIDLTKLVGELNSIEVLSCDGKSLVKKVSSKANKIIKKMPLETLSEINRDGSIVEISGIYKAGSDIITTLLVKVLRPNHSLTLVLMKGEIDLATLQGAISD